MDAFGTVMTAFHAAHKVYELVKTIRDAPEEIQALQDQVQLMGIVLPKIKDVLQREGDSTSIALLVTKAEELTSTANPFLNKVKAIFQDKRKLKRLKWLFKAGEAKGLSETLRAFHASLSVVCAAHSIEFPDHIRASLAELDQRLEESFASIHHRLRDVHAHLDSTVNATLVGMREVVQEELTMSMEIFMCTFMTTLKREFRTMANEQRRGESHNFDQYSILYDTSDVAQATNVRSTSLNQTSTSAQRDNLPSAMTPTAFHHLPPLVSLNEPPCKHCGCQCHRAASVWRTPKSLGSMVGNHYVKIPFPHRLWPGMVQCDVPTCKKGWLMEVRSLLPYWFARVEMQTRVEALPVHFCIQTPRVNRDLGTHLNRMAFESRADVFKELLYSRRVTINDVDTNGRSLLHLAIMNIDNAITYLQLNDVINAISYLLEVSVPREWQDDNGRSAAELALYWIQVCDHGRASQLRLLEQFQVRLIGPLFQDDLNGVATRLGMTELHQRLFLPGPRLTAEGLVDLLPLLNTPDRGGWTPLYYAIRWASYAVEMLLNAGADPQLVEQPLHVAIERSDSTIIGPLIHAGADVNERRYSRTTPLIYLTEGPYLNKRYEKMNELVRHAGDKIDWDARDNDGKTALDYALEKRRSMKLVRLLKRYSSRDILKQGGGSAIQVGNWGWTYGDDGYANLYHPYSSWLGCECPLCVVERTRIREVTTEEEEEEASMPGGFKL
ncbi:hypothetical protein EW026_g7742 [Hermanssonia centrifuga]|uniref:Uncharacterized protein n=1 Tax=Hermanssonia centrifuga TaxID=98765 RepID=A0A4V3X9B4_9APHY|nr:hypothetical protein EW026_g7742 [Hermanssonia centrifuga]